MDVVEKVDNLRKRKTVLLVALLWFLKGHASLALGAGPRNREFLLAQNRGAMSG